MLHQEICRIELKQSVKANNRYHQLANNDTLDRANKANPDTAKNFWQNCPKIDFEKSVCG